MKARFFRSDAMVEKQGDDRELTLSSPEGFQLTYNDLRLLPDGRTVAIFNTDIDAWMVDGTAFSDVVIFNEEDR